MPGYWKRHSGTLKPSKEEDACSIGIRFYTLKDPADGSKLCFCVPAPKAKEIEVELETSLTSSPPTISMLVCANKKSYPRASHI